MIRSYDAKALYHHPELAVTNESFVRPRSGDFAQQPDIPVHVLYTDDDDGRLVRSSL